MPTVHREKFKPLGGPDGGNGGRGARRDPHRVEPVRDDAPRLPPTPRTARPPSGKPGEAATGPARTGRTWSSPCRTGTVVLDGAGNVLADLVGHGTSYVAAQGGRGGLGIRRPRLSARRKAPGFALLGEPGDLRDIVLELKTVADVALVGYPSAGKSSLISVLSAAKPKIADYPFTTLVPNLGVVTAGSTVYTIADVPGLIPGASQGKGLGWSSCGDVERCSVLVHVLDTATLESERDPVSDHRHHRGGTAAVRRSRRPPPHRRPQQDRRPRRHDLAEMVRPDLEARGYRVFEVSAVAHTGLRELSFALADLVAQARAAKPKEEATRIVIRPKAVDDAGFTVTREEADGELLFRVRGEKPERWVPPDRLQQRRGRRLPRRPAQPPRCRGGVDEGRRP
ncbi:hypothetical protein GCM10023238_28490 [Streptomyces heliomycini]